MPDYPAPPSPSSIPNPPPPETPAPIAAPPPPRKRLSRPLLIGGAGGVAALLALTAGYRAFSDRPGETAMARLVPANALGAGFIDTRPSSLGQWKMLGRITAAIKNEDLTGEINKAKQEVAGDLKDTPLYQEVLPYWSGGAAAGAWGTFGSSPNAPRTPRIESDPAADDSVPDDLLSPRDPLSDLHFMAAISVRSPEQVQAIVAKQSDAPQKSGGVTVFHLRPQALRMSASEKNNAVYASVIGSYLVFSESPESIGVVYQVYSGKTPGLASQKDYAELRQTLPKNASTLTYISTNAFEQMSQQARAIAVAGSNASQNPLSQETLSHTHGAMYAATLEENGFALSYVLKSDAPLFAPLNQIKPLSPTDFKRIPDGAVMAGIFSQPGKQMEIARTALQAEEQTRKSWDEAEKGLKDAAQLSIDTDVLPALQGETTFAVYPGKTPSMPFEGLLIINDANGANPAGVLEKLKKAAQKSDPKFRLVSEARSGATFYTLSGKSAQEMLSPQAQNDGRKIGYAQIGNTVLAATNPELLNQAVLSYPAQTGKTFASAAIPTGTQAAFLLLPTKEALKGIMPLLESGGEDPAAREIRDTMLEAVKEAPLSVTGRYQNGLMTSQGFFPVNPEKAVHALALIIKEQKKLDAKQKADAARAEGDTPSAPERF